jgi:hypothetical protein
MQANKTWEDRRIKPQNKKRQAIREQHWFNCTQSFKQQKQLNGRNNHIPINTNINVNGFNSPTKAPLATGLKRKIWWSVVYKRPILLTEINTGLGWKAERRKLTKPIAPQNSQELQYLSQVDFKLTLVKWNKKGYFILIKGAIHQKKITIINLYSSNVSAPNFIRHTLKDLKAQIDSSIVVVGDFNILLSPIDRSSK